MLLLSPSLHCPLVSIGEIFGFTRSSDCLLTWFWVRCSPELELDSIALKQQTLLTLSDNFLPQKEDGCWKPLNRFSILCQNSSRLYVHWQVVKGSAPRVLFDRRKGFLLCHPHSAYTIMLLKFHSTKSLFLTGRKLQRFSAGDNKSSSILDRHPALIT